MFVFIFTLCWGLWEGPWKYFWGPGKSWKNPDIYFGQGSGNPGSIVIII